MHIAIKDKTGKTVICLSGATINIRMIEPGYSITALENETEAGNEILTGIEFDDPGSHYADDPRQYETHPLYTGESDYRMHDTHEMSGRRWGPEYR